MWQCGRAEKAEEAEEAEEWYSSPCTPWPLCEVSVELLLSDMKSGRVQVICTRHFSNE